MENISDHTYLEILACNDKTLYYKLDISKLISDKSKIPLQYETSNVGGNSEDLHILSQKIDRLHPLPF